MDDRICLPSPSPLPVSAASSSHLCTTHLQQKGHRRPQVLSSVACSTVGRSHLHCRTAGGPVRGASRGPTLRPCALRVPPGSHTGLKGGEGRERQIQQDTWALLATRELGPNRSLRTTHTAPLGTQLNVVKTYTCTQGEGKHASGNLFTG